MDYRSMAVEDLLSELIEEAQCEDRLLSNELDEHYETMEDIKQEIINRLK